MGTVTISEGIKTQKGSIIATVIKKSDLKEGTNKDGKPYTNQRFTLTDDAGTEITLTAWGDETKLLELGGNYEIAPWWQGDYDGKPQLGLGKFGQVKLLGYPEKIDVPKSERPTTAVVDIPELEASVRGTVHENTILLLQIEKEVTATLMASTKGEVRGDKIGMFTRINFYHLKGMVTKD